MRTKISSVTELSPTVNRYVCSDGQHFDVPSQLPFSFAGEGVSIDLLVHTKEEEGREKGEEIGLLMRGDVICCGEGGKESFSLISCGGLTVNVKKSLPQNSPVFVGIRPASYSQKRKVQSQ